MIKSTKTTLRMRETELDRAKKRIYVMDVRGNMGADIEKYSEIYNSTSTRALKQNKGASELADQPSHFERSPADDYLYDNHVNKSTNLANRNTNQESYDVDRNITIQNNPIFEDKELPENNGEEKAEIEDSPIPTKKGNKH